MRKRTEGCSSISEDKSDEPAVTMVNTQFSEGAEMEPSSELADFAGKSDKDSLILELKERLTAVLLKNEKLEEVLNLKEKIRDLQGQHKKLEAQLFSLKKVATNDSLINFYTGFPNYQTLIALYEFLNPGAGGQNVKFWLSGKGDTQMRTSDSLVKQGIPRSLNSWDEFFFLPV